MTPAAAHIKMTVRVPQSWPLFWFPPVSLPLRAMVATSSDGDGLAYGDEVGSVRGLGVGVPDGPGVRVPPNRAAICESISSTALPAPCAPGLLEGAGVDGVGWPVPGWVGDPVGCPLGVVLA